MNLIVRYWRRLPVECYSIGKKRGLKMKPDWKDAPKWAKWLAMDQGGEWYWYESEPEQSAYSWDPGSGRFAVALPPQKFWISTKVMRPTPAEAGSEGQPGA